MGFLSVLQIINLLILIISFIIHLKDEDNMTNNYIYYISLSICWILLIFKGSIWK